MSRIALLSLACLAALGCQKQNGGTEPAHNERPGPAVEPDDVQIEVVPVAGKVSVLFGRGGNIGVSVGDDGVLMIDDQFAPLAPKIRAAIAGIAGEDADIAFLFNTHHHGDHAGGNPEFGAEARIIAHDNVRKRVSTQQNARGRTTEPMPEVGWPIITYGERISVHFNGEEIRAMHVPNGHTDGDSVIHFVGSNVVHMGDQFFNGRFPFVDLESGGSVAGYIANVAKVLEMIPADAKIIPGHGPLASVEDLRGFHAMLTETVGVVRGHMKTGKSLEAIQKAGLPEKYASFGEGFIDAPTWIATIHASYSGT
ncbi:MBL fold metallo-hydrolase [Haliangium ochraceum]|uniref:Beta-lactamase domain protein n=1 Tax=Haliangium ochraceum (strain DSM 14365 / JCM 11303 / SMP-2) TaxID=502025 RepID=D0LUB9_HALO1|nr:MBL fold metallo-hydrolase [Haliangium ochraceum]ACY19242.1 beta-lactamase domain protein [Haliangium ochraceum DSM 14365]